MSLFPDMPLTIEPAANRREPAIWIRRLVIVSSLESDEEPIRNIEFRRGLNIIRTAERPEGDRRVIGHSVGKTLLTRLIRYCFGESHFAIEVVRNKIASQIPDGYVFAEFEVNGQLWSVARPLKDASSSESWAVSNAVWQECRQKGDAAVSLSDFSTQLERGLLKPIPDFQLPHAGHSLRFLDVLGWLTRDHDCRYRVYNEWREPDADSGTGRLHRDDAAFLLRVVMGLVDAEEKPLNEEHRTLLREQETQRKTEKRLARSIDASFPLLRDRLGLTEEECGDDPQSVGGLFPTKAREVVTEKVESLERLSNEIESGANTKELYDASIKAAQAVALAEDALTREQGLKEQAELELEQCEQSSAEQYRKQFSPARNCPAADDCPLLHPDDENGKPDPERDKRIEELKQTLRRHEQEIERLESELPTLRNDSESAQQVYSSEQSTLTNNIRGIADEIGRWNLLTEQADDYESWLVDLKSVQDRLKSLETEITESLQKLESARDKQAASRRRISDYFDWTLKQLLGDDADGAIKIDARGLHPVPGDSVAAHGAAMSTLATVIGLDLSCLTASICGLGHHPRFIIHDSPREAELESVLFDRIFQMMHNLEAVFTADQGPSFQYIITTSSPVPEELANEPFTRLILDKRDTDKLLLRRRF